MNLHFHSKSNVCWGTTRSQRRIVIVGVPMEGSHQIPKTGCMMPTEQVHSFQGADKSDGETEWDDPTVHDHRCFLLERVRFGARPLKTDLLMDRQRCETGTASRCIQQLLDAPANWRQAHQSLRTASADAFIPPPPTECMMGRTTTAMASSI